MTTQFASVRPKTKRASIEDQLAAADLKAIVVAKHSGQFMGLISDDDLRLTSASTASEIISAKSSPSIHQEATLAQALVMMQVQKLDCLPVVSDGYVRGVLTTTDVLITAECTLQLLREIDMEHRRILSRAIGCEQPI